MLPLGHLGIGSRLVRFLRQDLPLPWIYLGALLPDLIDKPLYYSLSFWTGRAGEELGLISSTRTFGHTGILLLCFVVLSRKSPKCLALCLGIASHLFLDLVGDSWEELDQSATLQAVLFPLLGFKFFVSPFENASEHLASKFNLEILSAEAIGAFLLFKDWQRKQKPKPTEILS